MEWASRVAFQKWFELSSTMDPSEIGVATDKVIADEDHGQGRPAVVRFGQRPADFGLAIERDYFEIDLQLGQKPASGEAIAAPATGVHPNRWV